MKSYINNYTSCFRLQNSLTLLCKLNQKEYQPRSAKIMLLYLISLFTNFEMYSSEPYSLIRDDNMTELSLHNPFGSDIERLTNRNKNIRVFKNAYNLKISVLLDEKVNIKILNKFGAPAYLRQSHPSSTDEIMIDTSSWHKGRYKICFLNTFDEFFLSGEFDIY